MSHRSNFPPPAATQARIWGEGVDLKRKSGLNVRGGRAHNSDATARSSGSDMSSLKMNEKL